MPSVLERLASALADHYRVERELGAGGMATVYLAHDLRHDRKVALKVLKEDIGATLGPERFLAEIRTTAKLQHPHILPLLDSGAAGHLLYYVMPFVDGESLRDRLTREHQLPVDEAVRLTREVSDALAYAHAHGVVHRDIKPENILLHGNHALVADFGIALALAGAGGPRLTQSGLAVGTPQYMSPEQAMGDRAVDARADQYALAAVTYEMLTGAAPFTGATAQAIIARKVVEAPPAVCVVRPAAGPVMEQVVRRGLALLPADRFDTVASYAAALAEAARNSGAHLITPAPQPATTSSQTASAGVGRRWRMAAAAVGAVTIVAAAGLMWRRTTPSGEPALLRMTIPTGTLAMLGHGKASAVAISPDGRTLAYVTGVGSEGQLMLRRLDAATATPVPEADKAFAPFFSPDGLWLGYADAHEGLDRARLRKRNLADGTVFDLAPANGLHGAAWTRDGRIILGGTTGTGWAISVIPEGGGTPEILVPRDSVAGEGYLVWPALTPDGEHVVFTRLAGNARPLSLDLLELKSGKVQRLHRTEQALNGGGTAAITTEGILVFAADGALYGAELDVSRGRLRGRPVALVPDVLMGLRGEPGLGHFALGRDGTLVYVAGDRRQLGARVLVRWEDSLRATPVLRPRNPESAGGFRLEMYGQRLVPRTDRVVFFTESETRNTSWLRWYESSEIWEAGPAEERARRLAPPRVYNPVPSWDGEWIYFNRVPEDRWTSSIYRQRRDGSGAPEQMTAERPGILASPYSLTGDGKLLFFMETDTVAWGASANIWAVSVEGDRTPRPVLVGPDEDLHPAISPDGRWLAWTRISGGEPAVHVAPFPALTPERRVTVSPSMHPAWGHDGSTLYYINRATGRIEALPFSGGPEARTAAPRPVSGVLPLQMLRSRFRAFDVDARGRVYTVAPDLASDTLAVRDLAVLANWGATLRAAVRR
ncbi:MAG TPA: protein kinase [Gemmatimonadales bacterium]|nr:protein kinase [Gemmatimonadales bacterium]